MNIYRTKKNASPAQQIKFFPSYRRKIFCNKSPFQYEYFRFIKQELQSKNSAPLIERSVYLYFVLKYRLQNLKYNIVSTFSWKN